MKKRWPRSIPGVLLAAALLSWVSCPAAAEDAGGAGAGPVYVDGTARLNKLLASSLQVAIPSGVYMLTGELRVRDGQVIAAERGAQVTLKAARGYNGAVISTDEQRITVRGLTLDGNYPERMQLEGNAAASLVNIVGSGDVLLEDNIFRYAPAFAIRAFRSARLQVRGNTFLECYHAVLMDGNNLESGVIEKNVFRNTAAFRSIQHITAINTVNLAVRDNTMSGAGLAEPTKHGYEGTWGNSIYIFNSTGHRVEHNKVSGNYWSSLVSGLNASHAIIRGNSFADGVATANSMWVEQAGAEDVLVDGNQLDGGLLVGDNGGDHVTITNNAIRSRGTGIDVSFAGRHVVIRGNTITSKSPGRVGMGIYLWDKSTPDVDVVVSNNTIRGFDRAIAVNNPGSRGAVYGIRLSGNVFQDNNADVWVPASLTVKHPLGQ